MHMLDDMDVSSVDGIHVSTIFAWLLYSGTSLYYDYRCQSLNVYIPFEHTTNFYS